MTKSQTTYLLVVWIISAAITFGFDLQHQQQTLKPNQHALFSPPRPLQQQNSLLTRKVAYRGFQMRPFWQSSSGDNNNKANSDNDNGEENMLPSEDMISNDSGSSKAAASLLSSSNTTTSSKSPGLIALLNDVGQSFKPMAEKATAKGYQADKQVKKILYAVQACVCYSLFIIYRAYRGLFVLLPAVFRQVYQKMEAAMNSDDLSLDDPNNAMSSVTTTAAPETKVTWRTKITVSVLATVVTVSYVLGGTLQMATKFFRTITKTSSVPKSFEAAADEMVDYEDRIRRIGKINGDEDIEPSGFAP
jgi:hypothetical protein